jgi:hypothetical protein
VTPHLVSRLEALSRAAGLAPFGITAATALERATGMPVSDARETGGNGANSVWPAAAERLKPRGVRVTIQQARHSVSEISPG